MHQRGRERGRKKQLEQKGSKQPYDTSRLGSDWGSVRKTTCEGRNWYKLLFQGQGQRGSVASQDRDCSGMANKQRTALELKQEEQPVFFIISQVKSRNSKGTAKELVRSPTKNHCILSIPPANCANPVPSHAIQLHKVSLEPLLPPIVAPAACSSLHSIAKPDCLGLRRVYSTGRWAKKKEKMLSSATDTVQK